MGKKNKKRNADNQSEVTTENKKIKISETQPTSIAVTNEIGQKPKQKKKRKHNIISDNDPTQNSVTMTMNNKDLIDTFSGLVNKTTQKTKKENYKKHKKKQNIAQDQANDEKIPSEVTNDSDNKSRKKGKSSMNEQVQLRKENISEQSIKTENKKKQKKVKQEMVTNEVEHDKKTAQEPLNSSNQTSANDKKEKPKKNKRKVVEEEEIDADEIDKYCDELDEFHNEQYENWVKLIEANLNKKN